jgi:signal-transduction protein with cAMP-binding, CBS, and nucleotidyltransferase domain
LLARAVRSDFQEMLFEQGGRRQGWEWVLCSRLIELAVRTIRICYQDLDGRQPLFIKGKDSAERVARYALQLQTRFYEHQTLDEAASLMEAQQIRRLPILNRNKELVGMLSLGDIAVRADTIDQDLANVVVKEISEPSEL